jgi:Rod binding domain-containing protein
MNADLQIATLAQPALQGAAASPKPTKDQAAAIKAAQDFEAVFITELLGSMFEGIKTDGPFGGGPGEQIFRSLLLDRYGQSLASQGGFGLADAVKRQLLATQEIAP